MKASGGAQSKFWGLLGRIADSEGLWQCFAIAAGGHAALIYGWSVTLKPERRSADKAVALHEYYVREETSNRAENQLRSCSYLTDQNEEPWPLQAPLSVITQVI